MPGVDLLGVARAHEGHHGGVHRSGVVRQLFLPSGFDQAGLLDLAHIGGHRQVHHIGFQAIDHRSGLGAGAAVARFEGDGLAGFGLPFRGEALGDLVISRFGDGVGDQGEGLGPCGLLGMRQGEEHGVRNSGDQGETQRRQRQTPGRMEDSSRKGFYGLPVGNI